MTCSIFHFWVNFAGNHESSQWICVFFAADSSKFENICFVKLRYSPLWDKSSLNMFFSCTTQPWYAEHGYWALWSCGVLGEGTAVWSQRFFKYEICSLLITLERIWPVWFYHFCPLFEKKRPWSLIYSNSKTETSSTITLYKFKQVMFVYTLQLSAQVGMFATQMCGWYSYLFLCIQGTLFW